MTLTVRTDHRVSEALAQYCVQTKQTKSDVVKQALAEFLEREALPRPTAWDAINDLVSGLVRENVQAAPTTAPLPTDLAANRKKYLGDYYAQRHARRRGPVDRAA
ncbi:MAG: hypothetical protein H7203_08630 [Rhizobacter sp.]|nr:hypothetical protein [Burkholderiales bacterium]